jgi:phage RecT family recombinase
MSQNNNSNNQISKVDTLKKEIFSPKTESGFKALLPKTFDVKQFSASLWLEIQNNPKLIECDNIIELARDAANFGLLPNGLAGQCYFILYKNKAKLIIGYKGYVTKLEEAGYSIEMELVTNEEVEQGMFQELRGSETKIIHNPIRRGIRTRENIALGYIILKKNGLNDVVSVLSKEEIEEMAKTEKWVNGKKERQLQNVWTENVRETDFGQMCLKTLVRNVAKKINLKIANEMSAYEGKRDQAMINVTPASPSKTANIPTNIDFTQQKPIEETVGGGENDN